MISPTYTLRQTNAIGGQENLYIIEVHEHADGSARQEALNSSFGHVESHATALSKIREELSEKKKRLLSALETVEFNLDNADTLYALGPALTPRFEASFDEFVAQLQKLKDEPGYFELHTLRVSNKYLNAGPGLFVLQLPEYDTIIHTFTEELCALVLRALEAAGFSRSSDWNGLGLTTWSIRVVDKTTVPA